MTAVVKHISVHPNYRRCRAVGIFDDIDAEHRRKNPTKPRVSHAHVGINAYVKHNDFGLPAFLKKGLVEHSDRDLPGKTGPGLGPKRRPATMSDVEWRKLLIDLGIKPD